MKTDNKSLKSKCPRCDNPLAADAPEGLCGRCLARLYLTEDSVVTGAETFAVETPSPEEIAHHFPQLEVLTCLGRGGMGVVYKARQKTLDRFVALKILAPEREKDPQFAERFVREAQALARLSHPHIVTIYDFGQADGLFFLLMEFVDGLNLRQLLRTRLLEPQAALAIVAPICDALQYAHDQGIVHRDMKPENLLLDKAGQVKIADFGIAKMLGKDARFDEKTCVGTPAYMAPEQSAATQAVDHRADIYSLGVVFYEMLTGELPAGSFELPSRKVQIDVRLDEIVLRALSHEPELRYQGAGQMRTAVESVSMTRQEISPKPPISASNANVPNAPGSRGNQQMHRLTVMTIGFVAVFLIAISTLLYKFSGRSTGSVLTSRNMTFAGAIRHGLDAFERGEYQQAAADFDEAIRQNLNHSEAHRWRADASLNQSELDKALSEYDEAIRLDPKNAIAFLGRGAAWTEKGEYDSAIAAFDAAIQLRPMLAGDSFYKRYSAAVESFRGNTQNPTFARAVKRGGDAFERGDYQQAAVAWDEAISLDPNHSEAHRWRGDASLNQYEFEKAMSEYDEAIRLDPKNAMAYLCRGIVWTEKRESDQAIAEFERAIQLDPELSNNMLYKRYSAAAEKLRTSNSTRLKK